MDTIHLSVLFLSCLFGRTEQLTCLSDCSNIYVRDSGSIMPNQCTNSITSDVCKARIVAYYQEETGPKYFNYTFGLINNSHDEGHVKFVKSYMLKNFTQYHFIVNAKKSETILITDIYCSNKNDCALFGIQQLFRKYSQQINPFYKLKPFIYSDLPPKALRCYDSRNGFNVQCSVVENPVCTFNSGDGPSGCSSDLDVHIHYNFTISSPSLLEATRASESIICNQDKCNDDDIVMKLEKIARRHIYDEVTIGNTANGQHFNSYQIIFGFLTIIIYCIV